VGRAEDKAQRDLVAAALHGVAHATGQLGTTALHAILPHLVQAQQELTKELRQWTQNHAGEHFTAQKLRLALAQVNRAMDRGTQLAPAVMAGLKKGGAQVKEYAKTALEKELLAVAPQFGGLAGQLPIQVAGAIATQDHLLLKRYAKSAVRYQGQVRDDVTRALVVAQLKGETVDQATARLMDIPGQVFGKAKYKAERLARTELAHAYNAYHVAGIEEAHQLDDEIVMRWDASLDRRSCGGCKDLHGRVVEVKGGGFKAEWLEGKAQRPMVMKAAHPPLHPNCRCVVTPWRQDWGKVAKRDQAVYDKIAADKAAKAKPAPAPRPPKEPKTPRTKVPKARTPAKAAAKAREDQQAALDAQLKAQAAAAAQQQAEAAAQAKAAADRAKAVLEAQALAEQQRLFMAQLEVDKAKHAKAHAEHLAREAAKQPAKPSFQVRIEAEQARIAASYQRRRQEQLAYAAEKKAELVRARKIRAEAKKAGVAIPKPAALEPLEARKAELEALILQKRRDLIGRNPHGVHAQMVKENLLNAQRELVRVKAQAKQVADLAGYKAPKVPLSPEAQARKDAERQAKAPPANPTRHANKTADTLANGKVVKQSNLGGGANGTFIVEIEGTDGKRAKGVWKPVTGEAAGLRRSISKGTYYKREAAASNVADMLGVGDMLPPTVVRQHKGVWGSVQGFAEGAMPGADFNRGMKYDKAMDERMRVFDYIIGNTDRHGSNVMHREGESPRAALPVLIDHGLCFPKNLQGERFIQPGRHHAQPGKVTPLDPAVVKHLQGVDPHQLAQKLHESGIEPEAIRPTLERLAYLKSNPAALAAEPSDTMHTSYSASGGQQWNKPSLMNPARQLTYEDESAIDKTMQAVTGTSGRGKASR